MINSVAVDIISFILTQFYVHLINYEFYLLRGVHKVSYQAVLYGRHSVIRTQTPCETPTDEGIAWPHMELGIKALQERLPNLTNARI